MLWKLSGQCVRMTNYDIMYRWGMTSSMHSAFIRSKEGSSVINKEEQRRKVQRHPSLLLSDLSTNLLASAACPQPGTAAGASPLLFPEGRLPVGSVRLLLLGREGDPRPLPSSCSRAGGGSLAPSPTCTRGPADTVAWLAAVVIPKPTPSFTENCQYYCS